MEELASEVGGSEDKVHVFLGVDAGKSTCAVRSLESSFVINDNDNDNDNDISESTTSHAQRHGLTDLDAGRGKPLPVGFLMWFSNYRPRARRDGRRTGNDHWMYHSPAVSPS